MRIHIEVMVGVMDEVTEGVIIAPEPIEPEAEALD